MLVGTDAQRIVDAASRMLFFKKEWQNPYGNGKAGERIVEVCKNSYWYDTPEPGNRKMSP
jgi:UDP-N-acetylglucosamine 2-epimerase (non-hydrolysing)